LHQLLCGFGQVFTVHAHTAMCELPIKIVTSPFSDRDLVKESNHSASRERFALFLLLYIYYISTVGLFDLMTLNMCHMLCSVLG